MLWPILTACAVPTIGALITYGLISPRSQVYGKTIWHGPVGSSAVALTFDDGPTPGGTDAILDILRRANIPATFFVIGENAERHPDLLRRIRDEGHIIANHTWHHHHHAWLGSRKYWCDEILRTDDLIEKIVGIRPLFFRPPIGIKTPLTLSVAHQSHHQTITWSIRARDGIPTTPENILARFTNIQAGDIAILHDGTSPQFQRNSAATIAALPKLLEFLKQKHLQPVRLDELIDKDL
jgi:peptidoglycan/xylan/chitin deacetylase (PgdA/CDA1 family)